ncbi:hypothetical protein AAGQ96_16370 [Pantoea sp. MBD-2R]|uniref:hypothetical protein n=1 Tax=Pantoea sp. MBD-2R TaxID=3141540 RepID=UPI003183E23B
MLKAKPGIAPIAWPNDALPQLDGDTPLKYARIGYNTLHSALCAAGYHLVQGVI